MIFFVCDMFAEQYEGGAELTTEAIIKKGLFPVNKVICSEANPAIMEKYKDAFWIFGNYRDLSEECLMYAAKNLHYSVLEYDYKFCFYRSIKKHEFAEGACTCVTSRKGKLVSIFLHNAKATWWMSQKQMEKYQSLYPFLKKSNNIVLNSVFSDETLEYVETLDTENKNDTWLILDSPSWIKGAKESINYAEKNNLKYELIWDIPHSKLLDKLAQSKGIIFFPQDSDTCPRMTVEARLLGCEIISNDNMQHKDEPWFKNKNSTIKHLRQRTNIFWKEIENIAAKNLNIPQTISVISDLKFKIVVPFFNCERWIKKCINSMQSQKYKNFECFLIDDASTDNSAGIVKKEIANDSRFNLIQNREKKYALSNIAGAIEEFNCNDDDVIILLDGDDWFASSLTLNKLCESYGDKLMTYGSYVFNPSGIRGPEPSEYSNEVIKTSSFRKDQWRASHLRTFKYELWKRIDHNDLKDENGDYYKMTYDQAIMFPLLEMAGDRSAFIPEILHVYNKDNPLSVDKNKAQEQCALAQKIRSKKTYSKLV